MTSTVASVNLQPQFTSNGLLDDDDDDEQQVNRAAILSNVSRPVVPPILAPASAPTSRNTPPIGAKMQQSSSSPAKDALNSLARSNSLHQSSGTSSKQQQSPRVSDPFQDDAPRFDLDRELELEEEDQLADEYPSRASKGADEMQLDDDEIQALMEQEAQQESTIAASSTTKNKGKEREKRAHDPNPVSTSGQLQSNGLLDDDDGYIPPSSARPSHQSLPSSNRKAVSSHVRQDLDSAPIGGYRPASSSSSSSRIPDWAKGAGETTSASTRGAASTSASTSRQPYGYQSASRDIGNIPQFIPAGVISAITFEGDAIIFERRKRLKGYKVRCPEVKLRLY